MGEGKSVIQDVSFAGVHLSIDASTIEDFIDDAAPIEFQDTEVCNIEWSCNGRMIRTVKPSAIFMSVSVIPGSPSDNALRALWQPRFSNGGDVDLGEADTGLVCTLTYGSDRKSHTYSNGTCVSGPAGPSARGDGKMGGNTYTFAFENY